MDNVNVINENLENHSVGGILFHSKVTGDSKINYQISILCVYEHGTREQFYFLKTKPNGMGVNILFFCDLYHRCYYE